MWTLFNGAVSAAVGDAATQGSEHVFGALLPVTVEIGLGRNTHLHRQAQRRIDRVFRPRATTDLYDLPGR